MTQPFPSALLWLHLTGNFLWIGSILAVAVTMAGVAGDAKARGELALAVYRRLAVPGFVLAFLCGLVRLLMDTSYYLAEHHWMHAKLPFALGVIGLHHAIGAKAKKMAAGATVGSPMTLATALLVAAALSAFFAIFKVPA